MKLFLSIIGLITGVIALYIAYEVMIDIAEIEHWPIDKLKALFWISISVHCIDQLNEQIKED
jgi:hypothetical protein